jgi:hypothetical protein
MCVQLPDPNVVRDVPPAGISRVAWNQPIEAIAPSVRQYPRTPAPRSTATTELAAINDELLGNECGSLESMK